MNILLCNGLQVQPVILNVVLDARQSSLNVCVGLHPLRREGVISMVQLTGGPCREVVQCMLLEEMPQKCMAAFSRSVLK